MSALAYAGFSKGLGQENLRILKTKRKVSLLRFSPILGPKLDKDRKKRSLLRFNPVFGPKLGEDQKKTSLQSDSVRLCAQTLCQTYKGGACRTFAYLSMLIILFWRPKGGVDGTKPPPKYAPA